VKAVTVRQPWASLLAHGHKTIETRTRPTKYRGRFAIHAGAHAMSRPDPGDEMVGLWRKEDGRTLSRDGQCFDLPLGAIVGSAVVVDCVPIVTPADVQADLEIAVSEATGRLYVWDWTNDTERDVTDQTPLGDFTPGRWAWLIADAQPVERRCPACWGGTTSPFPHCRVCLNCGDSLPVPARGRLGWWEWTP
jgi:activating signal cointegrator 1